MTVELTAPSMPQPSDTRRDAHGRLASAHWESRQQADAPRAGRWLVAFDGSPMALRAVDQAIALVGAGLDAAVDVVHVHPWLSLEAAETVLLPRAWQQSQAALERLDAAGLPWRLHVRMGEPAACIVALADEIGSAGILMGSHGLGAVEQLVLGSVAYKVIHLARVPVLVVR